MTDNLELLGRYAAEGSDAAFAEFTKQHVDLVYSAALRLVHGDVHRAEDVTQQVFAEVARNARRLARHPALVGWLYTTTRLMALRLNRIEQRRHAREQEANRMNQLLHDDDPARDWAQLGPVLEDAMHELDDKDRHAVLLRFFQNKRLNEVGVALNLSENAARMRVERALDKLRGKLARRGITTTTAALAVLISANAVQAAPAGLVASLSATAIAGSAVHGATVLNAAHTLTMTTIQKAIVTTALVVTLGTGIYSIRHSAQLRRQIQALQQERVPLTAQIQQLEQQRTQAVAQIAALTEENGLLKSGRNENELLKLRGEVGTLRQRVTANLSGGQPAGGLARLLNEPATKEYMRRAMMDKLKSMYGDLINELKLSPGQTDQFIQLLSNTASKRLSQLTATAENSSSPGQAQDTQDIAKQLRELLGDAGAARFKEFSDEMPARATLKLLNDQLGTTPLADAQSASLIQIIKAEPTELTQGMLGSPDKAFMGSQADIDNFLQQVTQSNERILQQASSFLSTNQLVVLDNVLAKAIESRRIQGAAFFQQH